LPDSPFNKPEPGGKILIGRSLEGGNMALKVLLADDHQMIRQGLRVLLEAEKDIVVVGEAENGRAAVRMVAELSPDVVVMDLRMPDLNGIDATRQALAVKRDVKIVGLSAESSNKMWAEMLRAGAMGYVVKDAAFEELVPAIRIVAEGKVYLSPAVAGAIVGDYVRHTTIAPTSAFTALSSREREVIQLIAEGNSTKQIATHLGVSVKTVETHRRNLMEKLGLDNIAALTKYAIREGVTSL
jgi:DNA-binding NarL/FixJ family response regulator